MEKKAQQKKQGTDKLFSFSFEVKGMEEKVWSYEKIERERDYQTETVLFSLCTPPLLFLLTSNMKDEAKVSGDQYETNIPDKNELFIMILVLIHSLFCFKARRLRASHLQCEFLTTQEWNIVIPADQLVCESCSLHTN